MAYQPSRLQFNNVISMGVSYSWSHEPGAAVDSCSGFNESQDNLIKRKRIYLWIY